MRFTTREVSVPLRGLWFLSIMTAYDIYKAAKFVSVPLRGLWFLSHRRNHRIQHGRYWFPSPCGDYGSYHNALNPFVFCVIAEVSVPLRGLWFLSMLLLLSNQICNLAVSVPLRGLWFLSLSADFATMSITSGFRPLTGIMVLIRTLYKWLYEAVEMAFCGADHIFSSFFVFCKKMIFKKIA